MENELDEGRKRTLGVIAAIFACRKLAALEGKPSPAREMAFRDSIDLAAEMMRRMILDGPHPGGRANLSRPKQSSNGCFSNMLVVSYPTIILDIGSPIFATKTYVAGNQTKFA